LQLLVGILIPLQTSIKFTTNLYLHTVFSFLVITIQTYAYNLVDNAISGNGTRLKDFIEMAQLNKRLQD